MYIQIFLFIQVYKYKTSSCLVGSLICLIGYFYPNFIIPSLFDWRCIELFCWHSPLTLQVSINTSLFIVETPFKLSYRISDIVLTKSYTSYEINNSLQITIKSEIHEIRSITPTKFHILVDIHANFQVLQDFWQFFSHLSKLTSLFNFVICKELSTLQDVKDAVRFICWKYDDYVPEAFQQSQKEC